MARRRIEMFQYRQVLARLRAGDTDRELCRCRLMGREKVAAFRAVAVEQGWLGPDRPLPDEGELAAVLGQARRARSTVSSVEPWRAQVTAWVEEGVQGTTIHAALKRNHGYTGSYSAVYRMIAGIRSGQVPEATMRLHFAPGEAAQVDYGAGPMLRDADGVERRILSHQAVHATIRIDVVEEHETCPMMLAGVNDIAHHFRPLFLPDGCVVL